MRFRLLCGALLLAVTLLPCAREGMAAEATGNKGTAAASAASAKTGKTAAPAKKASSAKTRANTKGNTKAGAAKAPVSPPASAAQAAPKAAPARSPAPAFPPALAVGVRPAPGKAPAIAPSWQPLMRRLADDGIDAVFLHSIFSRMGNSYSHTPMGAKVNELFSNKFMPPPPRKKTSAPRSTVPPVYKGFVTSENVERCREYLLSHAVAFGYMEATFGVPKEIVAGLLMVETRLGTFLGTNSSFWSLACMAAADKPERVEPTVRALPLPLTPERATWLSKILHERSNWAYRELLALARHSSANGLDPLGMPGSVYGAIGICQFMPSNLPKYAVDGNKDGIIDLFDPADAIPSVGNFLKQHGWSGKDRASRHKTLMRYNRSTVYANTILALAEELDKPAGTALAGTAATPGTKAAAKKAVKPAAKPAAKTTAKSGGKKARSTTGKATSASPARAVSE